MSPAKSGLAHAWSWCSSRLRVEPTLVRSMTRSGFALYRRQNMIFDSLVADSLVESVDAKSQQTLNCALSVDLL
jgi:hypothetical protein